MAVVEELPTGSAQTVGYGPNVRAVSELIARARRLSEAEVHALAGAVAWQWQPLTLPMGGSFAAARSEASATTSISGRSGAAANAVQDARRAALDSPGGRAVAGSWSWAENGLAGVLIGVIGAIVCAQVGLLPVAVAFGLLAVTGTGVVLAYESGRMTRMRLVASVEAAALALVVADLISAETAQALGGPWSTVMHD